MPIYEFILKPAFAILNAPLKLIINTNGDYITIRLYMFIVSYFMLYLLVVIWQRLTNSKGD